MNSDRRSMTTTTTGPPPPVAKNSRFAKLAEADHRGRRGEAAYSAPRGPPPPVQSRFAAMAEAERPPAAPPAGPPPVATNSRFAAAAAMAQQEEADRRRERFLQEQRETNDRYEPRGSGGYAPRGGGGPPPVANSRFSAAVAADADYMDREERDRRDRDRERDYADRRGGGGGYHSDRRGPPRGGFRGNNNNMDDLPRGPRASQWEDLPKGPRSSMEEGGSVVAASSKRVDALLNLATEKKQQAAPLEPISKEHEGNMLQLPVKALKKDNEEEALVLLGAPQKEQAEPVAPAPPAPPAEKAQEIMKEFIRGQRLGEELKAWTEENRTNFPMLDKVIFHLLQDVEKLNPNPECLWAQPDQYGAALLSLCEDDIVNQMHVLWGIQFYCDKMGFPKIDNEYLVQSMFRAMYKYDLAEEDAFMEWKEDETEAFEQGKLKAVIQTTEWFAWLEEEEEDEDEEEEEEEEERLEEEEE